MEAPVQQEGLLTVEDVARLLGIHENTVRRLYQKGELPHIRVGRVVRFQRAEVNGYIARQTIRR